MWGRLRRRLPWLKGLGGGDGVRRSRPGNTSAGGALGVDHAGRDSGLRGAIIRTVGLTVYYRRRPAIAGISVEIPGNSITAVIGPSGTGKSTFLRSINRLNDLIPGTRVEGEVYYRGIRVYSGEVDVYWLRTRIGMVFQKPNPFPMSIYENVAFGLRVNGVADESLIERKVRDALVKTALWDEVKDRLHEDAYSLSMGQQQRLAIARALAVEPDVLLLDEPTANLDPISTMRIEEVLKELKERVTIVIVTHSISQAKRIADYVIALMPDEHGTGRLAEYGPAKTVLEEPSDERVKAYVSGLIG